MNTCRILVKTNHLFTFSGQGLDVQIPDRQRLIGSPAPQSMRNKIRQQRTFKKVREYDLIENNPKKNNFVNLVKFILGVPHHHPLRLRGRLR